MSDFTPKNVKPQQPPTNTAKSLAVILREEFGVPFNVYDSSTGQILLAQEPTSSTLAAPIDQKPRATALPNGTFAIVVPFDEGGRQSLVAVGSVACLTQTLPERTQEQARMQKWVQSVTERLRQQAASSSSSSSRPTPVQATPVQATQGQATQGHAAQATAAWDSLLALDKLFHRVRIHKDPPRYQRRILDAAADLLDVQTLIWVAPQGQTPVIGGEPILSQWDCQQLVTQISKSDEGDSVGLFVCNDVPQQPWANRCKKAKNLLALSVSDQRLGGWILALNKRPPGHSKAKPETRDEFTVADHKPAAMEIVPFRRSDAALLTPFVSLLGLYSNAAQRFHDIYDLLVGLARALTSSIDAKDPYTFGHSERVARISVELSREMGMTDEEVNDIYLAGLLHDIGKIGIPDAILGKPTALDDEEMAVIQKHVTIGHKILEGLEPISHLLPAVLYHHERYDGGGYPEGLKGEAIPLLARIIAVADSYDAMSSSRPYRDGMPHSEVERRLAAGAGIQWDAHVIEAFARCKLRVRAIRQRGIGDSLRQALNGALRQNDGFDNESLQMALATV